MRGQSESRAHFTTESACSCETFDHSRTAARPTGDVARARGPSTRYTSPSSVSVNWWSLKSSRNQPADAQLQKQASSDRASRSGRFWAHVANLRAPVRKGGTSAEMGSPPSTVAYVSRDASHHAPRSSGTPGRPRRDSR